MSDMSSGFIRSSERPVPLKARSDLTAERIEYQGIGHWVVKEPVGLRYYRLRQEQYYLLQLLDGQLGLEQLRDAIRAKFPTMHLQLTDIQRLVVDLYEKGLVYSDRVGQGESLLHRHNENRRKKFFAALRNVMYIKLPGWDPTSTFDRLYPLVRWMFSPLALGLATAIVLFAWGVLLVQFEEFGARLPEFNQFFGWPNLIYLWLTLAAAKVLHEFGHGLSCKHFGGECHEIGLIFLVFSPTLYCDVSDSWMLKEKWKRIAIGAAGMIVEVFISAVAVLIWWFTQPGLLHFLCLNLFFVTTATTVIFNANPLMRFDGYFMMADLLEILNLRPKSDQMVSQTFSRICLGIETPRDPFMPETGLVWFVTYAIAAALYRWLVLFGIVLFLYTLLKPYGLQSIGITLAVISIASIVINLVMKIYRIISAPRQEPMSRPRIAISLTVLAVVIGSALMVPVPLYLEAAYIIEPHGVRDVFTTVSGKLQNVSIRPGDAVKSGDVLAELVNVEMEEKYRELNEEKALHEIDIRQYHALEDGARRKLAEERLNTVREQIADFEQQMQRLTIRALCDGVIVAPPRVDEKTIDEQGSKLVGWHGTPLDARNRDSYLPESTHLLSIAPDDKYQAVLMVDQSDRNELKVGRELNLKMDQFVWKTYRGEVAEIAQQNLDFVPPSLIQQAWWDIVDGQRCGRSRTSE